MRASAVRRPIVNYEGYLGRRRLGANIIADEVFTLVSITLDFAIFLACVFQVKSDSDR